MKALPCLAVVVLICVASYGAPVSYGQSPCPGPDEVMVRGVCVPAFDDKGDTDANLGLKTDRTAYADGHTVTVLGSMLQLRTAAIDVVTIMVRNADANIVGVAQVVPNSDGSFETAFVASGPMWKKGGMYEITATYGSDQSTTEFDFGGGVPFLAGSSLDLTAGSNGMLTLTFDEPVTLPAIPFAGDITVRGSTDTAAVVTLSGGDLGNGDIASVGSGSAGYTALNLDISGAKRIELNGADLGHATITLPDGLVSGVTSGSAYDAMRDHPPRTITRLVPDFSPPVLSSATVNLAPATGGGNTAGAAAVPARLALTFDEAVTAPGIPSFAGNITIRGGTSTAVTILSGIGGGGNGGITSIASGIGGDKTFELYLSDPEADRPSTQQSMPIRSLPT